MNQDDQCPDCGAYLREGYLPCGTKTTYCPVCDPKNPHFSVVDEDDIFDNDGDPVVIYGICEEDR